MYVTGGQKVQLRRWALEIDYDVRVRLKRLSEYCLCILSGVCAGRVIPLLLVGTTDRLLFQDQVVVRLRRSDRQISTCA